MNNTLCVFFFFHDWLRPELKLLTFLMPRLIYACLQTPVHTYLLCKGLHCGFNGIIIHSVNANL